MLSRFHVAMMKRTALLAATCLAVIASAGAAEPPKDEASKPREHRVTVTEESTGAGIVCSGVPLPPPSTCTRQHPVPSWDGPLRWRIVIADRRNNRLLEVTPDKRSVWEYPSPTLIFYRGSDDV